jgi:hypothetical protein
LSHTGIKSWFPRCLACIPVTINTFRHIHKVAKSDYKLRCVRLPVSPYGTMWLPVDRFHEILFSGFLLKSVEKIQFWLQLDKIKRHFTWKHIFVTDFISNITKVTDAPVVAMFTFYRYEGYQTTYSRIIFHVFATWTNFTKILVSNHNPEWHKSQGQAKRGIKFLWQYLIFVGLQYGTCFMLPFSCLEFSRIFWIFGKFVDLCCYLH